MSINEIREDFDIINFKGIDLRVSDADVIRELEKLTNGKYTLVKNITDRTKMGFIVEQFRVIGLGLYDCGISALPKIIGNLTGLKTLNLARNHLVSLPETLGNLSNLQSLDLGFNMLRGLPNSFEKLIRIERLNLENNQGMFNLPEIIGNLPLLKTLILYHTGATLSSPNKEFKRLIKQLRKKKINILF